MYYYSETGIKTNRYIKCYDMKDDAIICYLANGEKYIVPSSKENLAKIEDIMLKQAGLIEKK